MCSEASEFSSVKEVFCSVQGEGPYVGTRQAFVRFSGCNLSCEYCDTDFANSAACNYENAEGSGIFEKIPNPVSIEKLEAMLQPFEKLHSISLTGGEPLLHANFIKNLDLSYPLYLETNMTMPEQAKIICDKVAYVAGDFKLPEAIGRFCPEILETHVENTIECFKLLRKNSSRDCFCKIIVGWNTNFESVISAVEYVADYVSCVILQPETQNGSADRVCSNQAYVQKILELQRNLLEMTDTRIIPQTHRMWGCL
ncbi:MAG: 7-carboxy-7-deazaguanine synthase [Euryarchaeota archaeon]|nr:7-carboxy-7-deazaguanine synthase [Euryarchaeota archaeon]